MVTNDIWSLLQLTSLVSTGTTVPLWTVASPCVVPSTRVSATRTTDNTSSGGGSEATTARDTLDSGDISY